MLNKADVIYKVESVIKHYNMMVRNIERIPKIIQTKELKELMKKIGLLTSTLAIVTQNNLNKTDLQKFLSESFEFRLYFWEKIHKTSIMYAIVEPFQDLEELLCVDYNTEWF